MDAISIISLILGILSLILAYFTTKQFSKGVKNGALRNIRLLINRLEEDKAKLQKDSFEWLTMHHTQQDLDALFKNLQEMFKVADKDAPTS